MSRDKPYQSRHGFDVVARVPFSYISGKLKAGLQISIWKALPWQIVSSEFMSKRRGRWPHAINPKAQRCQKAEKWVAETLSFHIQDHPSHAVTAQHREMEQKTNSSLWDYGYRVIFEVSSVRQPALQVEPSLKISVMLQMSISWSSKFFFYHENPASVLPMYLFNLVRSRLALYSDLPYSSSGLCLLSRSWAGVNEQGTSTNMLNSTQIHPNARPALGQVTLA